VSEHQLQQALTVAKQAFDALMQVAPENAPLVTEQLEKMAIALGHLEQCCQSTLLQHQDFEAFYEQAQALNADLERQIQQRTAEVQWALNFESMLKRITDRVRDSLVEGHILQTAVEELTVVLGLGGCNASLYDWEQGTSTICYEYIDSVPTSRGKVARMERFPEIYHQLRAGRSFQFCSLMPNPERGHVALLACPIFVDANSPVAGQQQVLGDLWLIHHKEHVFNEFEIRMVQQVANQCAIAIRQARLYQTAQGQVAELERLNRLKDEFLSTVSHELRTPISNVRMAVHMLRQNVDEERRRRYFEILESEATREAELIDDLLDLQRLEVSSYPIERQPLRLEQWLAEVVKPFYSRASNRQQSLSVTGSPLPTVMSDGTILRRIVAELLNNACKYTPSGGAIALRASVRSPAGNQGAIAPLHLFTEVENEAIIPAKELPHIFEKFYRIPYADPWKQGGTGLGLALVKKLVHQLGGEINVQSEDGVTTFAVDVPVELVTDSSNGAIAEPQ
jgi:signal transduction histidine kinase